MNENAIRERYCLGVTVENQATLLQVLSQLLWTRKKHAIQIFTCRSAFRDLQMKRDEFATNCKEFALKSMQLLQYLIFFAQKRQIC